jgi:GPI mannosyltransferase 2
MEGPCTSMWELWRPAAFALGSRWALLALGTLSDALWPDYDTSKNLNYRSCDFDTISLEAPPLQRALTSPVVWDAVYFDRIAQCGYEYEQYYAFFPGIPSLMKGFGAVSSAGGRAVLSILASHLAFAAAAAVLFRCE